jgi:hypothetical protein
MLSPKYLETDADSGYLRATFSKEAFDVGRIIELQPYKGRENVDQKTYVKAQIEWMFEGYEGDQTCHFNLVSSDGKWLIDWFLC